MPCGLVPFPFGDCRVCADKATGIHYGVATCEGCKGFYKRSIPKASSYKCFFGGSCVLSKQNRNRCKACRFKRCLQVGMSTTAVKMGRIPKVDKERALQEYHQKQKIAQEHPIPNLSQPAPDGSTDHQASGGVSDVLSPHKLPDGDPPHNKSSDSWSATVGNSGTEPGQKADSHTGMAVGMLSHEEMLSVGCPPITDIENLINPPDVQPCELQLNPQKANDATRHQTMAVGKANQSAQDPVLVTSGPERPQRSESVKSNASSTRSIFSPLIIKELLTQVIQSGNGPSLSQTIKNQLFRSDTAGQEAVQPSDIPSDFCWPDPQTSSMGPHSQQLTGHDHTDLQDQSKSNESWSIYFPDSPTAHGIDQKSHDLVDEHHQKTNSHEQWTHSAQLSSDQTAGQERGPTFQDHNTYISAGRLTDELILGIMDEIAQTASSTGASIVGTHADLISSNQMLAPTNQHPPHSGSLHERSHAKLDHLDIDLMLLAPSEASPNNNPSGTSQNNDHSLNVISDDMVTTTSGFGMDDSEENNISLQYKNMELDPLYVERIEDKFNLLYYVSQRVIRLQEKFMMLELTNQLPIHPLNKVQKPSRVQVQHVWELLMASVPESNKIILDFCQSVPHFSAINSADQALLLQEAYFDIWLICHSRLFHRGDTYLRFKCGMRYSRFWMSYILPESLITDLHKFTAELNRYNLHGTELIMLCVLRLINPEREGLTDVQLIHRIHGHFFDLLIHLIEKRYKGNHGNILVGLIRLMPSLVSINEEQKGILDNFSVDSIPMSELNYSDDDESEADEAKWNVNLDLSPYEKIDPSSLA